MTQELESNLQHVSGDLPYGKRESLARQVKRALLLDDDVFAEVSHGASPFKRGVQVLLWILGIVVIARVIGFVFGLMTAPRLGGLETLLRDFITGLPWYSSQVAQSPGFAQQFQQGYKLAWEGIRGLLGVPTLTGTVPAILWLIASTFISWLLYGALAHMLARWFGGEASYRQLMGPLALSYAPLLLLVIELWPGAHVPVLLMFLLLFILKYLAIRRTYGLSPAYTLVVTTGPYLIALLGLLFLGLFGLAFGLNSIPGLGNLLRFGGGVPGVNF